MYICSLTLSLQAVSTQPRWLSESSNTVLPYPNMPCPTHTSGPSVPAAILSTPAMTTTYPRRSATQPHAEYMRPSPKAVTTGKHGNSTCQTGPGISPYCALQQRNQPDPCGNVHLQSSAVDVYEGMICLILFRREHADDTPIACLKCGST